MDSRIEEHFARSLASNDTRTRSKALKRLTQWVVARSSLEDGFTELEFLKLWKGLYMCMWHSDKPLVQEELANNLARLVVMMRRDDVALQFVRVFFSTIAREWHIIDRLRLDKFYMLIRKIVGQTFKRLQNGAWQESVVGLFTNVVENGPLYPDLSKTTLGVQLHVLEVYVPELLSCSPVERGLDLLQPALRLLAHTREPTVAQCVCTNVLDCINEESLQALQLTAQTLSDSVRSLAIDRETVGRNRRLLYDHCKRLSGSGLGADSDQIDVPPPTKKPKLKRLKRKKGRASNYK